LRLYRNGNAIEERMFGRFKDFRRIATRYDRLVANFLAAICLAATVSYCLWVRILHNAPSTPGEPVQHKARGGAQSI
jgi:hypothetical protein